MIVFRQYWLKGLIIELWQQLALRVTFNRSLMAVFLSGQDLSPPFIKCILFGLELLLLLLQAPGCGDELSLEVFLVEGFLLDNEVFIAVANLLFGLWHVVADLRIFVVSVYGAIFTLFPFILFGCGLDGVFGIFGIVRSLIISGAGISILCTTRS